MTWFWPSQLDRIERKLDQILQLERKIMADEAALDAAISDLGAAQDEESGKIDEIIAKLSAETSVDLTDEIASLQAIRDKAKAATDAITVAVTPPEPTP